MLERRTTDIVSFENARQSCICQLQLLSVSLGKTTVDHADPPQSLLAFLRTKPAHLRQRG